VKVRSRRQIRTSMVLGVIAVSLACIVGCGQGSGTSARGADAPATTASRATTTIVDTTSTTTSAAVLPYGINPAHVPADLTGVNTLLSLLPDRIDTYQLLSKDLNGARWSSGSSFIVLAVLPISDILPNYTMAQLFSSGTNTEHIRATSSDLVGSRGLYYRIGTSEDIVPNTTVSVVEFGQPDGSLMYLISAKDDATRDTAAEAIAEAFDAAASAQPIPTTIPPPLTLPTVPGASGNVGKSGAPSAGVCTGGVGPANCQSVNIPSTVPESALTTNPSSSATSIAASVSAP